MGRIQFVGLARERLYKIKMKRTYFYLPLILVLLGCSQVRVPVTVGVVPTYTASPIPTFDHVQVPTLTDSESEETAAIYLENNGNCELPCVWGLLPGFTEYQEALDLFEYLGWIGSDDFGYRDTGTDLDAIPLAIRFGVYSQGSLVERLKIVLSGDGFRQYASFFSVPNVVRTLGEPADVRVNIGVDPGINEPPETLFELLLYYKEDSLLIKYGGTAIKVKGGYSVCPGDLNRDSNVVNVESGYVAIYVADRQLAYSPDEVVRPFWELSGYYKYLSFEEAFGRSLSDFTQEMSENAIACFTSPIGVWQQ